MSLIEKIFTKKSNQLLIPLENYQGNNFKDVFSYPVKKMLEDKKITQDDLNTSIGKYLKNMSQITYNNIKEYNYITDSEINKKIPVKWPQFLEYGISSKSIKDNILKEKYFKNEIPKVDKLIKKEISLLLKEKNTF